MKIFNCNKFKFKSGDIVVQIARGFDRKCFVQEVKLERTFVQVLSTISKSYTDISNYSFEEEYANILNLDTQKTEKINCMYLRPLTDSEAKLLEMEKKLPEIEGIF